MNQSNRPIQHLVASRRGFLGMAGATGAGLFLAGCGSSGGTGSVPANTVSGTPIKGGTLKFAWLGSPESLDPHVNGSFAGVNLSNNTTDKLLWQNPATGELGPWLATKWENNDQLTEFTFTLREDVTFSDGSKLNAKVIKDNFDQYVHGDPALKILPTGAPYLPFYKESQVVSEYVVKIIHSAPAASFLQFISYSGNVQPGILAEKTLKMSAAERLKPANLIASGPFTITEYVPNEHTTIVRRDDYNWGPPGFGHKGAAYLDKIIFQTIPESSVRVGALQSGSVDAAFDIEPTDQTVLSKTGYTLISSTIAGINLGWAFNLSLAPTNDINVRRAIIAATDRASIKKNLLAITEGEAKSSLANSVPGYTDYSTTALAYNLDKAKSLLDQAGWKVGPNGIRVKNGQQLNLKATSNILVPSARVGYESIQATLKEIGVGVDILFDTTEVSTDQIDAKYHLINVNTSRDDPAVLNSGFNPNLNNYNVLPKSFPQKAQLIKTLSAVETTLDKEKRAGLTKAATDLIHNELALYNPIFIPSQVAATKTVQGIKLDATSRLYFLDTQLTKS